MKSHCLQFCACDPLSQCLSQMSRNGRVDAQTQGCLNSKPAFSDLITFAFLQNKVCTIDFNRRCKQPLL